jgi:hypothetical protein
MKFLKISISIVEINVEFYYNIFLLTYGEIMKRLLLSLSIFTNFGLFATQISENLSYSLPSFQNIKEQEPVKPEKSINHIIFKVGPGLVSSSNGNIIPHIGIGYKSKISDSMIFQSSCVEISTSYKQTKNNKDGIYYENEEGLTYFPKVMGLHYFNKSSENRVFLGLGSNLSNYKNRIWSHSKNEDGSISTYYNTVSYDSTSVGISSSIGIEMGKSSSAINTVQLEVDQPIMAIYSNEGNNLSPRFFVSYVVGF